MSFGKQKNGLSVECEEDTIGVQDFADTSTWVNGATDSAWALDPTDTESAFYGKAVKLTAMQLDLAEDLVMHENGAMIVEFYMAGNPSPVAVYLYKSVADWISRASRKQKIESVGKVGSFVQYDIEFAKAPIFWTSAGFDGAGKPKFNKMIVRIENHEPYKKMDGVTPATIARPRYFAEIYDDPDVS